jgi:glutathione S-transferase
MKVRLYSLPGSHPGTAVRAMLEYKGIDFKRTDLVPFLSRVILRKVLGFARNTVPAIKIDGRRVQGSREISRELDRVQPDPPLFPSDPEKRLVVEEAERWGEEELQHPVRQIVLWAMRANSAPTRSYIEG